MAAGGVPIYTLDGADTLDSTTRHQSMPAAMGSKSIASSATLFPAIAMVLLLVASALAQPHGATPPPCGCNDGVSASAEVILAALMELSQDINQTVSDSCQ
ncbi:hypothetical protein SEVIR_7G201800v4 [Setaria viridis]|uniref:Uncharacterized protein n=1 Tax=Setaria viridis TaxID=4556 RepID=A0A4U6TT18_SETVI|nr:hypothetical protein SEVIR_7G201800v2 [Setaria viridis]